MALKLYYLSSEIEPFAKTYSLAKFSRNFSTILNNRDDIEIRLIQPKYGFISERKYILREVIRLKEIPIDFNSEIRLVNLKSAFIPDSRVQVYFLEDKLYFNSLPTLLYKARNGRLFKDNDERYAFFSKVALENLKQLFWRPDVIICNDWQTSFVPGLLKNQYKNDEFYKGIKVALLLHSIDVNRNYSNDSYGMLNLKAESSNPQQDNLKYAMKNSDMIITISNEKESLVSKIEKDSEISEIYKNKKKLSVTVKKNPSNEEWQNIVDSIEKAFSSL